MDGQHVLIVDDDDADLTIYRRHLSSRPHKMQVTCAKDTETGMQAFRDGGIDCVLLDYNLPAVDGLQVLDQMLQIDPWCPVIILTGVGDEEVAVSAMKRGAADYLVKGRHSSTELQRSILRIIENAKLRRDLESANDRMLTVLNTVNSGIVALNRHADIVLINPAARHMLGGSSDEVPFHWPRHIKFLDREKLLPLDASSDPINRALAGQRLYEEVNLLTRANEGPDRYVRVSSNVVDDSASAIRAVLVLDDITEEVTNREQVERANRLDALGQLTGGVAHDFNNLLGTLLYAIELTALEPQSERVQRILKTAKSSIQRGTSLTGRLLAFAKRQPALESTRSVTDVIHDIVAIAEPTIEDNIQLVANLPDQDLPVFCDQSQLENAVLNLILNARDAILRSGHGGKILIHARDVSTLDAENELAEESGTFIARGRVADHKDDLDRADGRAYRYIEIAITDDGPGMTQEVRRRSIDPFFTTKDTASGTGLGLSMVYGFIQQSGGELRIYSEEGYGTTIRMMLPRGTEIGERERPVEVLEIPRGDGETVLVVEDEPHLLSLIQDMLEALGYHCVSASSGPQALELLADNPGFDLLLTDIVLAGGISGFELAGKFRKNLPSLPVLYMSGYTGFTEQEMGDVVAPLISKPCLPSEMAMAIKQAFADVSG